jgi:uncharacterized Zn finger protein
MKERKKFKRFYCPKCKMEKKHEKIEFNPSFRFSFDAWKCKTCGNVQPTTDKVHVKTDVRI